MRFAVSCALVASVAAGLGAGCSNRYRASLSTGDEVELVRAIKANDLVVRKKSELARVRLVGVYAFDPNVMEKNDITVWAKRAATFAERKASGSALRVVLERKELDPRGRHLGYLDVGGEDVGRQLIEQGHGAVYTEYAFTREAEYFAAEAPARQDFRGLWGGPAATKRLHALRETWAAVRQREHGVDARDPWLAIGSR